MTRETPAGVPDEVLRCSTVRDLVHHVRRSPGVDVAALSRYVATYGTGGDCVTFAIRVPGADVPALENRVMRVGTAWDCHQFARWVAGADRNRLDRRALSLASADECRYFACRADRAWSRWFLDRAEEMEARSRKRDGDEEHASRPGGLS